MSTPRFRLPKIRYHSRQDFNSQRSINDKTNWNSYFDV